jgi:hypothetical protein
MGHVILKEFYVGAGAAPYFDDYVRRYTDMPMLVMLKERTLPDGARCWCRTATCAPATSTASSARPTTPSGRPSPSTSATGKVVLPNGSSASAGARRAAPTPGQVEPGAKEGAHGNRRQAQAVGAGRTANRRTSRRGRLPVLRRQPTRTSRPTNAGGDVLRAQRARSHRAGQGRRGARGAGGHRVRPAGWRQVRRRPRPRRRQRRPRATTTTRPTRRPGRSASPACRASR